MSVVRRSLKTIYLRLSTRFPQFGRFWRWLRSRSKRASLSNPHRKTSRLEHQLNVQALYLHTSLLYEMGGERGVSESPQHPAVRLNLTTIPYRLSQIHLTIETLLRQSVRADSVTLWLEKSNFSTHKLPLALRHQQARGLSIQWCEDLRSYKKLIPALSEDPNAIHVTCDDDVFYPRRWLEKMLMAMDHDEKRIPFHRGHFMRFKRQGQLLPYRLWDHETIRPGLTSQHLFPTGVGGVLYPPGCFGKDDEVLNESQFMKLAPRADDVWFRAMTLRAGYSPHMVDEPALYNVGEVWENIYLIPNTQRVSLTEDNYHADQNDRQIHAVFDAYDLYGLIGHSEGE